MNRKAIFILLQIYLTSITTSTVIINKPYKNLKILNTWKNIIKDRNLVQCNMTKEFQDKNKNCQSPKIEESKARKLREMLRKASETPACRRTQYKDQIAECRQVISSMFQEFLKYGMSSNEERTVYKDLITSFARYVLLLKEFKEEGAIHTDPKTNIQNFIDDQVFDMKRKDNPIISGHTFHIPQPNGAVAHISSKKVHRTGITLATPPVIEHPCDTKTVLDNQAKHLDNMAQTVVDKYDDPVLSQKMHQEGKLILVPGARKIKRQKVKKRTRRRRKLKKMKFNKYSFRFQNINKKIKKMKMINKAKYRRVRSSHHIHRAHPLRKTKDVGNKSVSSDHSKYYIFLI